MFDMANDSSIFRTREHLETENWKLEGNVYCKNQERYLPLYEAKLFHQYDHRFATFEGASEKELKNGKARPMTTAEKSDPEAVALPRYWVPEKEVAKRLKLAGNNLRIADQEPDPTRPDPTRPDPTRPDPYSTDSPNWLATRSAEYHQRDQQTDGGIIHDSARGIGSYRRHNDRWLIVFRDVTNSTNQRTALFTTTRCTAVSGKAPLLHIDGKHWLQAFRDVTRATDERTLIAASLSAAGVSGKAPLMNFEWARAVAATLVLANMNSLPLDWTARSSVGGVSMSLFIVKQLPVLPPETYLQESSCGPPYVQLVVPRVLELTYTSREMEGFAHDLGYQGPPFAWNEERRHALRSELDAIFAHMYGLDRSDMEWILETPPPGSSFPSLKQHEIKAFGEYRTQRLVLQAFDALARGDEPDVHGGSG